MERNECEEYGDGISECQGSGRMRGGRDQGIEDGSTIFRNGQWHFAVGCGYMIQGARLEPPVREPLPKIKITGSDGSAKLRSHLERPGFREKSSSLLSLPVFVCPKFCVPVQVNLTCESSGV